MKRTRISPVSAKRRSRDSVYPAARRAVWERADGRCEAMAGMFCAGEMHDTHHIAGRLGPEPHHPDGLLGVCAPCHDHIHAHPAEAYENGWMVSRQFTCPVCVGREGTWCPACDGTTEA